MKTKTNKRHYHKYDDDMSPSAVDGRLRDVDDLFQLGFVLKSVKFLDEAKTKSKKTTQKAINQSR